MNNQFGLGVMGCGGFGLFAMQQFMQIPGIVLKGVTCTHREAALQAARRFDAEVYDDTDEFMNIDGLDIIYIATPPFLHYEHAMKALRAGKHVICEKPLALTTREAAEMINLAESKDLLMVTNLMQRYNPLYDSVSRLINEKPLGEVIHGFFENYASDENLDETHWFWDRTKSGGIFVEHGVHFFDMFEGWLGNCEVDSAQSVKRNNTDAEEQVQCTVNYRGNILVNFYHGFTHPGRMDRQEMRILFEKGDLTLYEWVPTMMHINAIANEEETKKLLEIFPGRLDITAYYSGKDRTLRARGKVHDIYQMFSLSYGYENKKMHIYGEILRNMFLDQLQWIKDRSHKRKITEQNGYNSLVVALEADRIAQNKNSLFD